MDYFRQRREFRKLAVNELNLSTGQLLLYKELLDYANDEGKLDISFRLKNSVLTSLTGLTVQGLSQARNRLVQEKLITYTPGKKDKSTPTYRIIKLYKVYKKQDSGLTASLTPVEQSVVSSVEPLVEQSVEQVVEHKDLLVPNYDKTNKTKAKETEKLVSIPFSEIVDYLNEKTGKKFLKSSSKTKTLITARWNEGFKLDDFKKVIDTKTGQWKQDVKMSAYLRPETLFSNKFESYLNEEPVKQIGYLEPATTNSKFDF